MKTLCFFKSEFISSKTALQDTFLNNKGQPSSSCRDILKRYCKDCPSSRIKSVIILYQDAFS